MFNVYQAEQFRRQLSNAESYDKAILTYASGALGLSLTFGKELVPFSVAHHLWVLELSWIAWITAIVAVILSYLFGDPALEFQIQLADRYYNGDNEGDEDAFNAPNKWTRYTKWTNRVAGGAFVAGAVLTASFVCSNLENSQMSEQKKSDKTVNVVVTHAADAALSAPMAPMPAGLRTKAAIPAPMAQAPAHAPAAATSSTTAATSTSNAQPQGSNKK
jgi:hypothetical protein